MSFSNFISYGRQTKQIATFRIKGKRIHQPSSGESSSKRPVPVLSTSPIDRPRMQITPLGILHAFIITQILRQIPIKPLAPPPLPRIVRSGWIRLPHIHRKTETWARPIRNIRWGQACRGNRTCVGGWAVANALVKAEGYEGRGGEESVGRAVVEEEMLG